MLARISRKTKLPAELLNTPWRRFRFPIVCRFPCAGTASMLRKALRLRTGENTMARVKRGTKRRARRKKFLKRTKGFFLTKSKLYQSAQEAVNRAERFSYRDRRVRKRQFRTLWIQRIGAAARNAGHFLQPADARAEGRGRRDRPQDAGRYRREGRRGIHAACRASQGFARRKSQGVTIQRASMTNDPTAKKLAELGVEDASGVARLFADVRGPIRRGVGS